MTKESVLRPGEVEALAPFGDVLNEPDLFCREVIANFCVHVYLPVIYTHLIQNMARNVNAWIVQRCR